MERKPTLPERERSIEPMEASSVLFSSPTPRIMVCHHPFYSANFSFPPSLLLFRCDYYCITSFKGQLVFILCCVREQCRVFSPPDPPPKAAAAVAPAFLPLRHFQLLRLHPQQGAWHMMRLLCNCGWFSSKRLPVQQWNQNHGKEEEHGKREKSSTLCFLSPVCEWKNKYWVVRSVIQSQLGSDHGRV